MEWIYLDNNATTRPTREVMDAMVMVNETLWANPSSVHRFGQSVRQKVELARQAVAALIGVKDREIIFTSGGTEANNLALRGSLMRTAKAGDQPPALITTTIEHSAIRQVAADLLKRGATVVNLPVNREGIVSLADVESAIQAHAVAGRDVLVSVQWANNETGSLQPVQAIAQLVDAQRKNEPRSRLRFHIDATQAVGKVEVNMVRVPADLLTLAAHKFHGPKGIGALYVRTGVRLEPQNQGGPQERERRGGTENTSGIVGMGVAAEQAMAFLADPDAVVKLQAMRDRLEHALLSQCAQASVNAPKDLAKRLWNTSNIGFAPLEAEAILLSLSEQGLCASAGAACSSGSLEPSPVLLAMGVPEPVAHGSVRFSLSRFTTDADIDKAVSILPGVVARLAKAMPSLPSV